MTRILQAGFTLFILIVLVISFNTLTFGAKSSTSESYTDIIPFPFEIEAASKHVSAAIGFKTVTLLPGDPAPDSAKPWLDLRSWLEETYPLTHQMMRRDIVKDYTLIYTWPGEDETLQPLLFMAHQDVVPINFQTIDRWQHPAFDGVIDETYVHGRGTMDDKGSLVALMEAAETLARNGYTPKRTLIFVFGHDEEVSGAGAKAAMAKLEADGIVPFLTLDEGSAVIENNPLTGKPIGLIGVAEKGYVTIELIARGEGGHSSIPGRNNAVVRLAQAVTALDQNQMPASLSGSPLADMMQASAKDMSLVQRVLLANKWLFGGVVKGAMEDMPTANAIMRTTTAPTMFQGSDKDNVLPQIAKATVNFRLHPKDSEDDLINHIKRVTSGIEGIEIDVITHSETKPGLSPTDNEPYQILESLAMRIGGEDLPTSPMLVLGATDGRFATALSNTVYRFHPAIYDDDDIAGFHAPNERISIANIQRMIEGYQMIILASEPTN